MNSGTHPYKVPITLYYRDGCHLCEDMEAQLYELLETDSFVLSRVDIDSKESLQTAYNARVPVLFCEQTEVCEHFLDLQALRKAFGEALAGYNSTLPTEVG